MNSRRVSARSSGDEGHTDLPGGHRLAKSDAVFDAMGALDELSAALGLLRAATEVRENAEISLPGNEPLLSAKGVFKIFSGPAGDLEILRGVDAK